MHSTRSAALRFELSQRTGFDKGQFLFDISPMVERLTGIQNPQAYVRSLDFRDSLGFHKFVRPFFSNPRPYATSFMSTIRLAHQAVVDTYIDHYGEKEIESDPFFKNFVAAQIDIALKEALTYCFVSYLFRNAYQTQVDRASDQIRFLNAPTFLFDKGALKVAKKLLEQRVLEQAVAMGVTENIFHTHEIHERLISVYHLPGLGAVLHISKVLNGESYSLRANLKLLDHTQFLAASLLVHVLDAFGPNFVKRLLLKPPSIEQILCPSTYQ